jgi:hypothetical protein
MNCWEFMGCKKKEDCDIYPDHGRECSKRVREGCKCKKTGCRGVVESTFLSCVKCPYFTSPYIKERY